ncbi:MAG TPA: hypothetical protein VKU84_13830 [Stellaceae bacterium]|nr:hypothetical protein [Stellaceae bacterium]
MNRTGISLLLGILPLVLPGCQQQSTTQSEPLRYDQYIDCHRPNAHDYNEMQSYCDRMPG